MKTFDSYQTLEEELTDKEKRKVDSWGGPNWIVKRNHDKIFGEGNDHIELPLEQAHHVIDASNIHQNHGIPLERARMVHNILNHHGYRMKDYIKGLATNLRGMRGKDGETVPDTRDHKIGAILQKHENNEPTGFLSKKNEHLNATQVFATDPIRSSTRNEGLKVIVSRNKYDVAGMSTDRGWSSCADLRKDGHQPARRCLPHDMDHGTLTAYLVHKDDNEIKNPLARINLKRFEAYRNGAPDIYRPEGGYGAPTKEFRDTVHKFAHEKWPEHPNAGLYTKSEGLYNDDGKHYIIPKDSPHFHNTFLKAYYAGAEQHARDDRGRHYRSSEVMDQYEAELPALRHMSDVESQHAANHFANNGSGHHGTFDHSDLYTKIDYDNMKHGDDDYKYKHDLDDYGTLLNHHVALNPAHYMHHATNKAEFSKRIGEIYEHNKEVGSYASEYNHAVDDSNVFHHMITHHPDEKFKEKMGQERKHLDVGDDDPLHITDKHYNNGLADHYAEHGTDRYTHHNEIDHIIKHADPDRVHKMLLNPDVELQPHHLDTAIKHGSVETIRNMVSGQHRPWGEYDKEDHQKALDAIEAKMKGKEKPGEQIWNREHEKVFTKLHMAEEVMSFKDYFFSGNTHITQK